MKIKSVAALSLFALSAPTMAENTLTLDDVSADLKQAAQKATQKCYSNAAWKFNERGYWNSEYNEEINVRTHTKIVKGVDDLGNPHAFVQTESSSDSHIITSIGSKTPISFWCTSMINTNTKNVAKNIKIAAKNEKLLAKGKKPKKLKTTWAIPIVELRETTAYGRIVY